MRVNSNKWHCVLMNIHLLLCLSLTIQYKAVNNRSLGKNTFVATSQCLSMSERFDLLLFVAFLHIIYLKYHFISRPFLYFTFPWMNHKNTLEGFDSKSASCLRMLIKASHISCKVTVYLAVQKKREVTSSG